MLHREKDLKKIYSKRMFWAPISFSLPIQDLFDYSWLLGAELIEKENNENSECSDYYCNFCQTEHLIQM